MSRLKPRPTKQDAIARPTKPTKHAPLTRARSLCFDCGYFVFGDAGDCELDSGGGAPEGDFFFGAEKLDALHFAAGRDFETDMLGSDGVEVAIPAAMGVGICVIEDVQGVAGLGFPREGFDQTASFYIHGLRVAQHPANCVVDEAA